MVRDGYFYGGGFLAVAVALVLLTHKAWLAVPPVLFAGFFLWFFRDPERAIPEAPGLIVSPADGKVTAIEIQAAATGTQYRISIFLNVFNVHVNRAPIAGTIQSVQYFRGKYLNAMNPASAALNERNQVEIAGELCTVVFTQIAGLLARRIVFQKKMGEWVHRGERVGLIKFGSRVDVVFPSACKPQVKVGDTVRGGSSILAIMPQDLDEEMAESAAWMGAAQGKAE
jgi:phosphatidylserine decarboxylase